MDHETQIIKLENWTLADGQATSYDLRFSCNINTTCEGYQFSFKFGQLTSGDMNLNIDLFH